ncbi:MAG: carboxypeptidase M32 [Fimbriimonas sp.]
MSDSLSALNLRLSEVNALRTAVTIMDWDQQTYMPHGGASARAEHVGTLSRMAHEIFTADETKRLLEEAKSDASGDDVDLLRVVSRDLDLATKLPTALVEEKSKLSAEGHEKWVEARANNDFLAFAPILERMFEIARQEATYLGYTDHIYDALIDQYEEGATAADCQAMFDAIRGPQVKLAQDLVAAGPVDDSLLHGTWDIPAQKAFTEKLVKAIGFDMSRGRQDTAPHPFCTTFSIGDVRLTTRYKDYLPSAIFGSLHEAGHGMYEQGSPMEWDRTALAGGTSLGVHESQSRFWENNVGRSRGFWQHFLPDLKAAFPALGDVELDPFLRMINKVNPSFIRVEADELTYNLHVLVRFEIECDVLTGKLAVRDLPDAWNAKYEQYLGLTPPTDSVGCLQDVHWSMGSIGYFPTYSMGNLLSYQFWNTLKLDIPDAEDQIAKGEFGAILGWLQAKIYSQGRKLSPRVLVKEVTGKGIDPSDYLAGLDKKYRTLYGI